MSRVPYYIHCVLLRCILRLDHHCLFVGPSSESLVAFLLILLCLLTAASCVGIGNLKFFILFLIYTGGWQSESISLSSTNMSLDDSCLYLLDLLALLCGYQLLLLLSALIMWFIDLSASVSDLTMCSNDFWSHASAFSLCLRSHLCQQCWGCWWR